MINLKSMVSPIVKLSYCCSLAPFLLSKNTHKEYTAIKKRPLYIIRIIILIVVTAIIHYKVLKETSIFPKELNNLIITIVRYGIFFAILIGFPLYLIATYWNSQKMSDFINNLKQIGMEMEKIGLTMNFQRKYKWLIIQIYFKIFQMIISVLCFVVFNSDGNFKQTTLMIVYSIPFMLTLLISIQWTSFVNLLTMHFKYLNQLLKTLKYRQCFVLEDFTKIRAQSVIKIVQNCGLLYDSLCDESKRLNVAYEWQILYLIPHYFLITLACVYQVLLSFKNDTPLPILLLINGILGAVYILEFVIPCTLCKQEANRFSEILNKVAAKLQKTVELEELVS